MAVFGSHIVEVQELEDVLEPPPPAVRCPPSHRGRVGKRRCDQGPAEAVRKQSQATDLLGLAVPDVSAR
eukprot:1994841-Rhodomonas_salina.3